MGRDVSEGVCTTEGCFPVMLLTSSLMAATVAASSSVLATVIVRMLRV